MSRNEMTPIEGSGVNNIEGSGGSNRRPVEPPQDRAMEQPVHDRSSNARQLPEQRPLARPLVERVRRPLATMDLPALATELEDESTADLAATLRRLDRADRAIAYRLLPKLQALEVFESFSPRLQSDLVRGLQDSEVAAIFEELEPDDRVWLLDELPAGVAQRLLRGLSIQERTLTSAVLGYPQGSIGRRMSPEYVATRIDMTVGETLERINAGLDEAETVYTLPVLDHSRHVMGVVSLRDLLGKPEDTPIQEIMKPAQLAGAHEDAEVVARRCARQGLLALPVVDSEFRLVGILTLDDAVRILEHEEDEDLARQGGVEPLSRPYLSTPVFQIVKSRIVWLLVLAIGAALTVHVLSYFEATIAQVTILSLFVPLLIGTGGNTGNQAATTVTRALALGDVTPSEVLKVFAKELSVGAMLGTLLGLVGFLVTILVYGPQMGMVIGLTLLAVCTMAATVGGVMPLVARAIKVDPAVFSNPFITTFVDASGLVIYFLIAKAVLGI